MNETDETQESISRAFLILLAGFCRQNTEIHRWLFSDFIRRPQIRDQFQRLISSSALPGPASGNGFAQLSNESQSWDQERERLRGALGKTSIHSYGGLSWSNLEALLRRYQGNPTHQPTFRLAREWLAFGPTAAGNPALLLILAAWMNRSLTHPAQGIHLKRAAAMLASYRVRKMKSVAGGANWWKMHAVLHMLSHPAHAYRTRDFVTHLARLGIKISPLDFRRFCRRHGIRRDERPGRPRRPS